MLNIGSKDLAAARVGARVVTAIYKGATLIWEAVSSCFGAGYWINTYPWKNEDAWKN